MVQKSSVGASGEIIPHELQTEYPILPEHALAGQDNPMILSANITSLFHKYLGLWYSWIGIKVHYIGFK